MRNEIATRRIDVLIAAIYWLSEYRAGPVRFCRVVGEPGQDLVRLFEAHDQSEIDDDQDAERDHALQQHVHPDVDNVAVDLGLAYRGKVNVDKLVRLIVVDRERVDQNVVLEKPFKIKTKIMKFFKIKKKIFQKDNV